MSCLLLRSSTLPTTRLHAVWDQFLPEVCDLPSTALVETEELLLEEFLLLDLVPSPGLAGARCAWSTTPPASPGSRYRPLQGQVIPDLQRESASGLSLSQAHPRRWRPLPSPSPTTIMSRNPSRWDFPSETRDLPERVQNSDLEFRPWHAMEILGKATKYFLFVKTII